MAAVEKSSGRGTGRGMNTLVASIDNEDSNFHAILPFPRKKKKEEKIKETLW